MDAPRAPLAHQHWRCGAWTKTVKWTSTMCERVLLQSKALRPHRGLDVGRVRMLNEIDAGVYTR